MDLRTASVASDGLVDEQMVVEAPFLVHTPWVETHHVVGVFVRIDDVRGDHVAVGSKKKRDPVPHHSVDVEYDGAIVFASPAAANAEPRALWQEGGKVAVRTALPSRVVALRAAGEKAALPDWKKVVDGRNVALG